MMGLVTPVDAAVGPADIGVLVLVVGVGYGGEMGGAMGRVNGATGVTDTLGKSVGKV